VTNTAELLSAAKVGDPAAETALFSLLYSDLRRLAHSRLKRPTPWTLLETTALAHEAYLRLHKSGNERVCDCEVELQLGKFTESNALLGEADTHYRLHRVDVWRRYYVECLLGESLSRVGKGGRRRAASGGGVSKPAAKARRSAAGIAPNAGGSGEMGA